MKLELKKLGTAAWNPLKLNADIHMHIQMYLEVICSAERMMVPDPGKYTCTCS